MMQSQQGQTYANEISNKNKGTTISKIVRIDDVAVPFFAANLCENIS